MPITEIALSCGFESHSHLARVFKDRYGISPHRMRENIL